MEPVDAASNLCLLSSLSYYHLNEILISEEYNCTRLWWASWNCFCALGYNLYERILLLNSRPAVNLHDRLGLDRLGSLDPSAIKQSDPNRITVNLFVHVQIVYRYWRIARDKMVLFTSWWFSLCTKLYELYKSDKQCLELRVIRRTMN